MINNMELKKKAAIAIKKNYCKCIFVPVLFILCLWLNNLFVNPIDQYSMFGKVSVSAANIFAWFGVQVFLINPLFVGIIHFYICNSRSRSILSDVLPKSNYSQVVIGMFLKDVFILLWSCMFLAPGIVKLYEYSMVPYLFADCPELSWREVFRESKRLMKGNKMDTFVLELSFVGWMLLAFCTCGIVAVFWVNAYVFATGTELYLFLKQPKAEEPTIL